VTISQQQAFAPRDNEQTVETSDTFQPKFDSDGLIPAIVTDNVSGAVLMFAFMDATALRLTLDSGCAHFWSRSRKKIWKKGEESGNMLTVREMRTDCDQDVLWLSADVQGDGIACHTGEQSCFYRRLERDAGKAGGVRLVNTGSRFPSKT
jgi:phosphoribosyl-AMP cyclohydrolase